MTRYVCNFVPMYKTYIETKHENRDRLCPSEMGYAGYLLTRPRTNRKSTPNIHPTRDELTCTVDV